MTDSHPLTCDECQSRLEEFALDELPVVVRDRVTDHLADGCLVCNQHLAGILDGLAQLAYSLPTERPPMRVERALLNRIASQRSSQATAGSSLPQSPNSRPLRTTKRSKSFTRSLLAASVAVAATILGVVGWSTWRNAWNESAGTASRWDELQIRVDQANASQRFSAIPQLHFASMGRHAPELPIHGYIVQDQLSRQWHVYAFHLPNLPPGRAYQLWFDMGNAHFVPAAKVEVDGEGTMSCLIDVPSDLLTIQGLTISDEPATGSDHPTGENLFEARLP